MTFWHLIHGARCLLPVLAPLLPLVRGSWTWGRLGRGQRVIVGLAGVSLLLQGASLGVIYGLRWENNYAIERVLALVLGLGAWRLFRRTLPRRLRSVAGVAWWGTALVAGAVWGRRASGVMDLGLSLLMLYRVALALLVLLVLLRFRQWHREASRMLVAATATLLDSGVNLLVFTFFVWAAHKGGAISMGIALLGSLATALSFLMLDRCLRPEDPLARWTGGPT